MQVQERMNINDSEYAALYNASGFGPQKSLHVAEQEERIRDDKERLRIQEKRLQSKEEALHIREENLKFGEEHLQCFAPMFTGSEEQRVHSYAGIEDTPSPSSQDSASHSSSSIMHPMNLNFPTTFSTGLIPPASLLFEFEESFLPTPLAEGHLRLPLMNTCTLAIQFDHSTMSHYSSLFWEKQIALKLLQSGTASPKQIHLARYPDIAKMYSVELGGKIVGQHPGSGPISS
ncbi:hypothetical protein BDP27DRAFT_1372625 [Rhodocollybia butyracea]|uniref:Uncharacterized protein n=1 Tax=Rhodocollybia butyracea TaxID=206335 RepID=A0A9P5P9X4_9AGAR|nr:hypothetical protein BDP27DRAFT_1372625 [Rhodocollybia butyracea]